MKAPSVPNVDREVLREAIQEEYDAVACEPDRGFHFHTGRPLAEILGYQTEWLDGIPEGSIESFAGTGNPFSLGVLGSGERVVDIGCGAGIDSLIAANMVGPEGAVIGIDMTPSMLEKAKAAASGVHNVEFRIGFGEELPVPDAWADVIISNGVVNLMPDKQEAFGEMARVLKPGGRLQLGDILVDRPVPENEKEKIELWTG
jgi:arsenite methyltransferase